MVEGGACSKKPLYAGKTSSKLPGTRLNYTSFLITQISPGGIKENYSPSWNPVHKRDTTKCITSKIHFRILVQFLIRKQKKKIIFDRVFNFEFDGGW